MTFLVAKVPETVANAKNGNGASANAEIGNVATATITITIITVVVVTRRRLHLRHLRRRLDRVTVTGHRLHLRHRRLFRRVIGKNLNRTQQSPTTRRGFFVVLKATEQLARSDVSSRKIFAQKNSRAD